MAVAPMFIRIGVAIFSAPLSPVKASRGSRLLRALEPGELLGKTQGAQQEGRLPCWAGRRGVANPLPERPSLKDFALARGEFGGEQLVVVDSERAIAASGLAPFSQLSARASGVGTSFAKLALGSLASCCCWAGQPRGSVLVAVLA